MRESERGNERRFKSFKLEMKPLESIYAICWWQGEQIRQTYVETRTGKEIN
jgi:hypothetical protein